jgi:hypothetical protein
VILQRKSGDTEPVVATLTRAKRGVPLTGATVRFLMRPAHGTGLAVPSGLYVTYDGAGGLVEGQYFYVVSAFNTRQESLPSHEVDITVVPDSRVLLRWNPVEGAEGYRVYRGTEIGEEDGYVDVEDERYVDDGDPLTPGVPLDTDVRELACEIVDENLGKVQWTPDEDFFNIPGIWVAEYDVLFGGGERKTFPEGEYISVEVLPDLG